MKKFMQFLETKSKGEYVFKETAFAEVDPERRVRRLAECGQKNTARYAGHDVLRVLRPSLMQEMAAWPLATKKRRAHFKEVNAKVKVGISQTLHQRRRQSLSATPRLTATVGATWTVSNGL
jgi:alpha-L-rhamnosidase